MVPVAVRAQAANVIAKSRVLNITPSSAASPVRAGPQQLFVMFRTIVQHFKFASASHGQFQSACSPYKDLLCVLTSIHKILHVVNNGLFIFMCNK